MDNTTYVTIILMSVEFEDEKDFKMNQIVAAPTSSRMVRFLIRNKLVKTERGAVRMLLAITLLLVIIALAVLRFTVLASAFTKPAVVYYEDIPQNVRVKVPPYVLNSLPHRNAQ